MELKWSDLINKYSGNTAVVCGTGNCLERDLPKYERLSRESNNIIFFGCNKICDYTNIKFDYIVMANSWMTIERSWAYFNDSGANLLYAKTVDGTAKEMVESKLTVPYLSYSERDQGVEETIQNKFSHYCSVGDYGNGGTVAVHMLAFAVIMGCKKIYMDGVMMDYNKGKNINSELTKQQIVGSLTNAQPAFQKSIDIIREGCENIGVELYNCYEDTPITGLTYGIL